MIRIGLIADTHGLVRTSVAEALASVSLILHAGDVGGAAVLTALASIAPVEAVAGNVDDPHDPHLRSDLVRTFEGVTVHVSHGHEVGHPTPERLLARYDGDVLVFGHTHRALVCREGSRLVVNPGAAGPRRFDLAPSVAILTIDARRADVALIDLLEPQGPSRAASAPAGAQPGRQSR